MRVALMAAAILVTLCVALGPILWLFFHFQSWLKWWLMYWIGH